MKLLQTVGALALDQFVGGPHQYQMVVLLVAVGMAVQHAVQKNRAQRRLDTVMWPR